MKFNLGMLLAIFVLFAIGAHAQTGGRVITVNDVGDSVDASPGDGLCRDAAGKCTLRAAIAEANADVGRDGIVFDVPVPAVITLNLGELKVTSPLWILGRGARQLTIQRNPAPNFSAFRVFHLAAETELRALTVRNGRSFTTGGGILVAAGSGIRDVAITGNSARSGGGIAFQSPSEGRSYIERCLINSNSAFDGEGGGIYVGPGNYPWIRTSTITDNSAVSAGALAVHAEVLSVANTIARNSASQGVSGVLVGPGQRIVTLNTIYGPNTEPTSQLQGSFLSEGNNFVTNSTGSEGFINGSLGDQVSTNNTIDPMLGTLSDNGGQTDTLPLLPGSPAIDAGNGCLGCFPPSQGLETEYDQRRYRRRMGEIFVQDVGAFETGATSNLDTFTRGLSFDNQTQRHAFARVTVINTETMERRSTYIALWEPVQLRAGHTPRMSFEANAVYVAELHTKRAVLYSPQLIGF